MQKRLHQYSKPFSLSKRWTRWFIATFNSSQPSFPPIVSIASLVQGIWTYFKEACLYQLLDVMKTSCRIFIISSVSSLVGLVTSLYLRKQPPLRRNEDPTPVDEGKLWDVGCYLITTAFRYTYLRKTSIMSQFFLMEDAWLYVCNHFTDLEMLPS